MIGVTSIQPQLTTAASTNSIPAPSAFHHPPTPPTDHDRRSTNGSGGAGGGGGTRSGTPTAADDPIDLSLTPSPLSNSGGGGSIGSDDREHSRVGLVSTSHGF